MKARGVRAAAAALVAATLIGCASAAPPTPDPARTPARPPVEKDDPERERARERERNAFEPAVRDARDLIDADEPALAVERLETALRSNPSPQVRPELLALLKEAREAEIAESWLSVEIVAERGAVTIGDRIELRVRLRNRRDEPLVVPADASGAGDAVPTGVELSATRVFLRVAYREIDHLGSIVDSEWETVVELDGDVALEPRATASLPVSIDTSEARFRPSRAVFRRVAVTGKFRPVAFAAPGATTFSPVEFGPLTIDVFPVGYSRFESAPEDRLAESLRAAAVEPRFLPHVLFGAIALSRRDPEACAAALDAALADAGPELAPTARGCLDLVRRGLLGGPPPDARRGASRPRADRPEKKGSETESR